jgi:hypothetical protein
MGLSRPRRRPRIRRRPRPRKGLLYPRSRTGTRARP